MNTIIEKVLAIDLNPLKLDNPVRSDAEVGGSYLSIITTQINTVFTITCEVAAFIAFVVFIVSGFQYMTAAGNAESAKKAVKGIINSVVGLVVISLSWITLTTLLWLLSK
ncbi:MAG: hypothetical protein WC227_00590 [Patescibacteria group bacterium]|jgi:cytochrome bd-type quinol oxidase subunit 2